MVTQKFQTSELQQMNLLTIQEVADLAKVSAKTIYRWISDNKIPAIRLGTRTYRIPEKAIHIEVAWGRGASSPVHCHR